MKPLNKGVSVIGIVITLVVAVIIVGGIYFYLQSQMPKEKTLTGETAKTEASTSVPTNTPCDNYEYLISAASQCQPISVTISYSGIPFPLDPDMSVSGQTNYEIKKSSDVNNCVIAISSISASCSLSDKGRKDALSKGMTDAQITAQLQTINESFKSIAGKQTICEGATSAISTYLADTKNGNSEVDVSGNLSGAITTYTLSSGQKLICH